MVSISGIQEALHIAKPEDIDPQGRPRAAVAMVLRQMSAGVEALFIERAERHGDPWSGHMAFPGGRVDPEDPGLRAAAERETREEVGLDLSAARWIGRLPDIEGRDRSGPAGIVISAFVYHNDSPVELSLNHEVQDAFWVPVENLIQEHRHVDYEYGPEAPGMCFPGILVGDPDRHIIWGLTYRFLEHFFALLGNPLPNRWGLVKPSVEDE